MIRKARAVFVKGFLDSVEDPKNAGRLPVPQAVLTPLISMIRALI